MRDNFQDCSMPLSSFGLTNPLGGLLFNILSLDLVRVPGLEDPISIADGHFASLALILEVMAPHTMDI
jgi:hypothetical protein